MHPAVLLLAPALLAAQPATHTLVCLGDSLTAGYGLSAQEAYPALLQTRIQARGLPWKVVNAGVSGDTTAGGLRRLDWVFRSKPDLVLVALGANDGLRGIPPAETERNLRDLVSACKARGARVVIAGMQLPENFGPAHRKAFAEAYRRVAREARVPLIPFLLEGVALVPGLNQADGIHPNAEGQRRVADHLWRSLEAELLKAAAPRR